MRIFWVLLLGGLLTGCASEPRAPLPRHLHRAWEAHAARMRAITHFTLSAEGGIRAGGHGGTLMLRWTLVPQASQIGGYGPFGRLIFRLRVNSSGARLQTERGRFQGPNAGALLARMTGWRLPVSGLRFWILGIPAPGTPVHDRMNRFGLLASLKQAGWSVRYRRYSQTRWGRLPRFLTLIHAATTSPASPSVIVTLRIDRWAA